MIASPMKTIILNDILTKNNNIADAGASLYALLKSTVDNNETVVIDMEDATSLPSIFLNVSFGRLIDEFGPGVIHDWVSFTKITKSQAERLRQYIHNYKA